MSRADREIAALWNENARRWVTDSRAGLDIVRDYVNTPAFVESLPAITGCVGLDLGCGDGHHARIFSAMGASMTGVDVSEAMLTPLARWKRKVPQASNSCKPAPARLHFPMRRSIS
jgi:2-polyprenyl-3-methyl-5-hydroxy-6-metoxy-1,4-benzoquinol methylase